MSLRQYGLYKEYLLLPLLFVAVTVKCWKCFRIKQINETDQCKMEVSRLKVVKVGGVAFIINFNMRISRHVCDLRHAKRVMQACRERAFTFSIKFLWTVTYIKNKLMLFLLWLSVQGSFFFFYSVNKKRERIRFYDTAPPNFFMMYLPCSCFESQQFSVDLCLAQSIKVG